MNGGTMTPSSVMPFSGVGIGDPVGRIDVALSRDADLPVVSLIGAANAPLANVGRGFGTVHWDVGAGSSSAVNVAGFFVFAAAVYWKMGNPKARRCATP